MLCGRRREWSLLGSVEEDPGGQLLKVVGATSTTIRGLQTLLDAFICERRRGRGTIGNTAARVDRRLKESERGLYGKTG